MLKFARKNKLLVAALVFLAFALILDVKMLWTVGIDSPKFAGYVYKTLLDILLIGCNLFMYSYFRMEKRLACAEARVELRDMLFIQLYPHLPQQVEIHVRGAISDTDADIRAAYEKA